MEKTKEHSKAIRDKIVEGYKAGKGYKTLAKELGLPVSRLRASSGSGRIMEILLTFHSLDSLSKFPPVPRPVALGGKPIIKASLLASDQGERMASGQTKQLPANRTLDHGICLPSYSIMTHTSSMHLCRFMCKARFITASICTSSNYMKSQDHPCCFTDREDSAEATRP
ncbi:hypothetical protein MHYP_G00137740 [Metynnis hypsauchen]